MATMWSDRHLAFLEEFHIANKVYVKLNGLRCYPMKTYKNIQEILQNQNTFP